MKTIFSKDTANKKMIVKREFSAPLEQVWKAWTDSEILDQWWAPKPWKAETKKMDFREGGSWLYCMVGPAGERHWSIAEYKKVVRLKSFIGRDSFCDENGNIMPEPPGMNWNVEFSKSEAGTKVEVEITFASEKDLKTIVEMGFEQGFTMAHENLDQYLKSQFKLRNELSTGKARVNTYLNFPGNTEEAFNFYKSVFGTEFTGRGIQRFGDIPAEAGHPPIADNVKKMILHIELPILGGHVLMGTDAPKEMGFTLTLGNNIHISLDLETRAETEKLFGALSKDGKVSMPLADMFWGAYFGSFTDKYGINWMFNCAEEK
jgi:uncharacterized glyoxalase superfamily protein PhnB/uncharacterized protein YndB with AHSA1/START domain